MEGLDESKSPNYKRDSRKDNYSQLKLTVVSNKNVENEESNSPDILKQKPKKMFHLEDLVVIKDLGQGSFGKVKLVKHKRTN